jgi:zinc protease
MHGYYVGLVQAVRWFKLTGSVVAVSLAVRSAAAQGDVDLPYRKLTLPNGMVAILSEDHALPQVAVNVSFDVGSASEKAGRSGFAHLFEHLMFMGTTNAPPKAFDNWMEAAGGHNNAWTAEDRTDYFDVGPPRALPLLLWLEADRLRNLGPLIDQTKLDLQREVVLNERRQNVENRPYGVGELVLPTLLWPPDHPYHHPVIGAVADLRAASVQDVKDFFATWYDPSNASLAICGDFDPQQALAAIERWFGSAPSRGKPSRRPAPDDSGGWKTTLTRVVRETATDDVALAEVTVAWQSPPRFAEGDAELDLLANVLAAGKESRLYKALVYDQKIAQEVSARQESRTLASDFIVQAVVRPGVSPSRVEGAILSEIRKLRSQGVSAEEIERARNATEMDFIDQLQSIPERASLLNEYQAETGNPGYVGVDLGRYRNATREGVANCARKVLVPDAMVVLTITPKESAKP